MANANPNTKLANATIFYLLVFGLTLGWLGFALGTRWFVLGPRDFLDTNMLVSVTQIGFVFW